MGCFQKFYSTAEILGCISFIEEMEAKAVEMVEQEKTIVAVTGLRSSGKTTAINFMVGSEVWEPGNMDDTEKPLRVCFEPIEEDEKYQCLFAANREWSKREAIIYEFREEYIVEEGVLTEEIIAADMIIFMISATAPFNSNEVSLIKKMRGLNCQIVVNGIDVIKENDRQKVIDYISKINNSLGLPPLIFMKESSEEFGKKIRNLLPSYSEQKNSRKSRIKLMEDYMIKSLKAVWEEKNSEYDKKKRIEKTSQDKASEIRRMRANCYTIRMDIEEYRNMAKSNAIAKLSEMEKCMSANVMKVLSANPQINLDRIAGKEYRKTIYAVLQNFKDIYLSDLHRINSGITILNLPGWDQSTISELENYASLTITERSNEVSKGEAVLKPINVEHNPISAETSKILIGTGLVAGGFAVASLPPIVSVVGGLASAGVGGSMYLKRRKEEKSSNIEAELEKTFSLGIDDVKNMIIDCADFCYGNVIDKILECESGFKEPKVEEVDQEYGKMLIQAKNFLEEIAIG